MDKNKNLKKDYKFEDYERPMATKTDLLTPEEIKEKLEDYDKVEDIYKVPLGTHLRYFTVDEKGNKLFRMGGQLFRNNGLPTYVMLNNGNTKPWSVQIENAIFYKKLSTDEIKDQYKNNEKKHLDKIKELKEENKLLKEEIVELKKQFNIDTKPKAKPRKNSIK
jgi:putative NADH-flavin reductase